MKAAKRPPILRTSVAALLALGVSGAMVKANTLTWTGLISNLWETPGNWNSTPVAGLTPATDPQTASLIFQGAMNPNTFNNGAPGTFIEFMTFTPNATRFTLAGSAIFMEGGGGITNNSPNLQVIGFTNVPGFGGIQLNQFNFNNFVAGLPFLIPTVRWTAAAGDILMTNDVSFATPMTIIFDGAHNFTMTGAFFDTAAGAGSIVKNGTGTLLLTGRSTFLGNTTVNDGTLLVDGSIASLNTFVNSPGTLGGTGFIGGNVFNSGNVNPGNSPGTLTIGGDYHQTKKGQLTIEIRGKRDGEHDLLLVQGRADLNGTLRLVKVGDGPRLRVGEKITILLSKQGVDGEFDKVVSFETGTIVKMGVVYEDRRVLVKAEQGSFKEFAKKFRLTVNQRAVAGGLDKVAFRNKEPKLVGFLNARPLEKLPGDFDKIAPDELASIFSTGVALANVQTTNLQRRTADLRSGANGFSAAGLAMQGSGPGYAGTIQFRTGAAGPTGNGGKESKEMKEVAPVDNRWGAFLTGVGEWVDVGGDGNARGYDITTGGFTLGVDYKVTPNLALGINAGYAGTGAHLTNNGRVFVNGGKLGIYGTYFDGGFYIDSAVNGGYNSYETRRTALRGDARGSTDGGELNVLFGAGYDWKVGALTIGPTGNFQYTYIGLDGFTERGGLAPLSIGSQNGESLRTAIGFKTSYDWRLSGVIIKPELRAAWQHEYGDASFDVAATFGGGAGAFTVRGPEVGRDSLLLGAGFAILWNERTSTYFYYDGDLARTRYDSHAVSGGVRVAF